MGPFRTAFKAIAERERAEAGRKSSSAGSQLEQSDDFSANIDAGEQRPPSKPMSTQPKWLHVLVDEGAGLGNAEAYLILTLRPKPASTESGGKPVQTQSRRTMARLPVDGHAYFAV